MYYALHNPSNPPTDSSEPVGWVKKRKDGTNDWAFGSSYFYPSIAGLQCKYVKGYSKGAGYKIGQKFSGGSDHAWNMICLKGRWHLLDSTWGAGGLGDSTFTFKYNEIYFLTHPAIFIMDHLPEDPDCQLLETCLSHKQFENNVYPDNDYYNFNMVSYHPQICVIKTACYIGLSCLLEALGRRGSTSVPLVELSYLSAWALETSWLVLDKVNFLVSDRLFFYKRPLDLRLKGRQSTPASETQSEFKKRTSSYEDWKPRTGPRCPSDQTTAGPPLGYIGGLSTALQNAPDAGKGKASIAIESGCKMEFSFNLNETETPGILKLTDNGMNLDVYPKKTGQHILSIFARKQNSDGDLMRIMKYRVDCSFVDTSMIIPKCLHNPVGPSSMIEKAGLLQPSHTDPVIHADDGCCTISFRTERMLKITVNLRSDDIQTMPNYVILSVNKDKVELNIRLPQAGSYALLLSDDVTGYIGNYLIVCSNPNVKWSPFPSFLHNPVGPSSDTEKAGLLQPSHSDPIIYAEDGTCTISFALEKDVKIYCTLHSNKITLTTEMQSRHVMHTQKNDNLKIKVHLPSSGTYVLQIFIKPRKSTNSTYSYLCNYLITCSNPSVKWPMFPLAYKGWEEHFELVWPLEGVLPKNSNVFFRLKITDIATVYADGKMLVPLTHTDSGYWEGTCRTEGVKELFVSIKYNKESNTRHHILKYTIEGY
ncbi:unnamed protein product [Ranitomeya imitator]|uniref:KY-like immunoglobulin-like domain-containing protein n=1 Tax=Ranitomeya imitator TaxID=111125 RepID=A0ABN9MBH5_9NEOB|nr:unnamed protein product [Ranitomeya imitator]